MPKTAKNGQNFGNYFGKFWCPKICLSWKFCQNLITITRVTALLSYCSNFCQKPAKNGQNFGDFFGKAWCSQNIHIMKIWSTSANYGKVWCSQNMHTLKIWSTSALYDAQKTTILAKKNKKNKKNSGDSEDCWKVRTIQIDHHTKISSRSPEAK